MKQNWNISTFWQICLLTFFAKSWIGRRYSHVYIVNMKLQPPVGWFILAQRLETRKSLRLAKK